jgi:uncharacterized protein (TIGR03382 family)
MRVCSLGILTLLLTLLSSAAHSAPQHVRVSWDDSDTAHTSAITWTTLSMGDQTIVQYGTTPSYGEQAEGTNFQANGSLGVIHTVSLTDLAPETLYHYRVGGPGAWSQGYTFRTGAADGCSVFRFVALGDNRGDTGSAPSSHWNPILTEALSHGPAFILNTGDLVKDGDDDKQWSQFLEATGDGIASTPLMPSLGNHDDDKVEGDGASYNQIFTLPRNTNTGSEDYYYFRYGDALVVALSMATFTGGTSTFADQAAWLDEVFTNNPATWRFVYFHHPIYTGTFNLWGLDLIDIAHPPNELGQNSALVPIFDKHHVDMVFMGHNHFYQRFEPMCCGEGGDEGVPTGDPATGTTYVITGGAGAMTYDLSIIGIDIMDLLCDVTGSVHCDGRHHFMLLEIDGLDLTAKVYTTASQLTGIDPSNIGLIDEFTIHKTGPEPDCQPDKPAPDPDPEPEPDAGATDGASGDVPTSTDGATSDDLGPTPTPDGAVDPTDSGTHPPVPDVPVTDPPAADSGGSGSNGMPVVDIGSNPGGTTKKSSSGCGAASTTGPPGSWVWLLLLAVAALRERRRRLQRERPRLA